MDQVRVSTIRVCPPGKMVLGANNDRMAELWNVAGNVADGSILCGNVAMMRMNAC